MNDHMDSFFRYNPDRDKENQEHKYELGYGFNIVANKYGSYSQYMNLSQNTDEMFLSNYNIPIEKINNIQNLSENETKDLIKNIQLSETDKFKSGEIPKLLIMFHNFLNNRRIYVNWVKLDNKYNNKNESEDVILEQYYDIESAYSKNYSWWDSYSLLFIGPEAEDLKPGHYSINIKSIDIKAVKQEKDDNIHVENYKLNFYS